MTERDDEFDDLLRKLQSGSKEDSGEPKPLSVELPSGRFFIEQSDAHDVVQGAGGSVWLVPEAYGEVLLKEGFTGVIDEFGDHAVGVCVDFGGEEESKEPGINVGFYNKPFRMADESSEEMAMGAVEMIADAGEDNDLRKAVNELVREVVQKRAGEIMMGHDGTSEMVLVCEFDHLPLEKKTGVIENVFEGFEYHSGSRRKRDGGVSTILTFPLSQFARPAGE